MTLGVIALIALGWFVIKAMGWRRRAKDVAPPYAPNYMDDSVPPAEIYRFDSSEHKPAQLAAQTTIHEMPSAVETLELANSSGPAATRDNTASRV